MVAWTTGTLGAKTLGAKTLGVKHATTPEWATGYGRRTGLSLTRRRLAHLKDALLGARQTNQTLRVSRRLGQPSVRASVRPEGLSPK